MSIIVSINDYHGYEFGKVYRPYGSTYAALPQADKTRRNQRKRPTKCRKKIAIILYRRGQNVMSLVNLFLSSHCTVDKDLLPDDILKLRVFRPTERQIRPQGYL